MCHYFYSCLNSAPCNYVRQFFNRVFCWMRWVHGWNCATDFKSSDLAFWRAANFILCGSLCLMTLHMMAFSIMKYLKCGRIPMLVQKISVDKFAGLATGAIVSNVQKVRELYDIASPTWFWIEWGPDCLRKEHLFAGLYHPHPPTSFADVDTSISILKRNHLTHNRKKHSPNIHVGHAERHPYPTPQQTQEEGSSYKCASCRATSRRRIQGAS